MSASTPAGFTPVALTNDTVLVRWFDGAVEDTSVDGHGGFFGAVPNGPTRLASRFERYALRVARAAGAPDDYLCAVLRACIDMTMAFRDVNGSASARFNPVAADKARAWTAWFRDVDNDEPYAQSRRDTEVAALESLAVFLGAVLP